MATCWCFGISLHVTYRSDAPNRVHLSAHGFPVLCDTVYGRPSSRLGSVKNTDLLDFLKNHNGQMLHAEVLDLVHPVTGEKMHFRAPLPDDMAELKYLLESA